MELHYSDFIAIPRTYDPKEPSQNAKVISGWMDKTIESVIQPELKLENGSQWKTGSNDPAGTFEAAHNWT